MTDARYSEEQQPLENFFRAKGIKTKNEMADDVSYSDRAHHVFPTALTDCPIVRSHSCRSTPRRRPRL
jgi:hypothetical protein